MKTFDESTTTSIPFPAWRELNAASPGRWRDRFAKLFIEGLEGYDEAFPGLTPLARPGMKFLCSVPQPLGAVVKLEVHGERVVAKTESGIEMILPIPRDER